MEWFTKTFAALSTEELYGIVQLRQQVFVVEQNCVYLDADGYDREALHLFAVQKEAVQKKAMQQESVIAYCRLLPPGLKYQEASIGRVCTALPQRGSGLGRELMQRALTLVGESYASESTRVDIRISAQLYLQNFYSSLGFTAVSAPYDEDGIPHIEMLCTP